LRFDRPVERDGVGGANENPTRFPPPVLRKHPRLRIIFPRFSKFTFCKPLRFTQGTPGITGLFDLGANILHRNEIRLDFREQARPRGALPTFQSCLQFLFFFATTENRSDYNVENGCHGAAIPRPASSMHFPPMSRPNARRIKVFLLSRSVFQKGRH